jgi:hypothetical protein
MVEHINQAAIMMVNVHLVLHGAISGVTAIAHFVWLAVAA